MTDELFDTLEREHLQRARRALEALMRAGDDRAAWPHWRGLERGWDALTPGHRREVKRAARELAPCWPDGPRRLAVVEKLP